MRREEQEMRVKQSQGSELQQPHVVIVGGGFAGLNAARALAGAPVQVTLVDRRNHHLFQPLLYQVATAALSPADISAPIRAALRGQRNARVLLAEMTGVDAQGKQVLLGGRALPYDILVLATGAGNSYFGHPEWEVAAPGLKSLEEAVAIRRKILTAFETAEQEPDTERRQQLLTFVIVGGGPTGVELAGAIAELARTVLAGEFRFADPTHAQVVLVEAGSRILPTFPGRLSARAQRALERRGVAVITGQAVEQIDPHGVVVAGQHLPAHTVIWAAGVRASPAGQWLGVATDRAGRVEVRADLTVPDYPDIFVIGDTACVQGDKGPLPGVSPAAIQEGRYVARVIRDRLAARATPPFRYVDKGNLATVGRSFAVADIKGVQTSGLAAWLLWVAVHIAYLIGFRNRMVVMVQWGWAYLFHQRGARLIMESGGLPESVEPFTA